VIHGIVKLKERQRERGGTEVRNGSKTGVTEFSIAMWRTAVRGLITALLGTLGRVLISRLVGAPPRVAYWQSRLPSVLNRDMPVTGRAYPDKILFEWDEGDKEEGEPHAGGSAYDGRVMTSRTETRSGISDLAFV